MCVPSRSLSAFGWGRLRWEDITNADVKNKHGNFSSFPLLSHSWKTRLRCVEAYKTSLAAVIQASKVEALDKPCR
jgi:hypothetical protein